MNGTRRHLTVSQRAMVAGKIANLKEGKPINTPNKDGYKETSDKSLVLTNVKQISQAEAAKLQNVSVSFGVFLK